MSDETALRLGLGLLVFVLLLVGAAVVATRRRRRALRETGTLDPPSQWRGQRRRRAA